MKRDKQDEQQRHAQRDAVISMVFRTIVNAFNKSCDDAYIFIGRIWGLGKTKIMYMCKHRLLFLHRILHVCKICCIFVPEMNGSCLCELSNMV